MIDAVQSLREQLAQAQENLRLIRERKSEFVIETDVPLQLVKEERRLVTQVADLRERLARLVQIPCPYRGLEPFEPDHAPFYFGRDTMLERLVARVNEASLVTVVGPSGCGKSSLVRAGLVSTLRQGALPGSREWATRILCPGRDPLWALAMPLVVLLEPEALEVDRLAESRRLADHLREATLPLDDVLTRLRAVNPELPHLLLIADQFEELYTECNDEATRQAFIRALLTMADVDWITAVLTLRADFYGHILADRSLGERVDSGLVNVLPMNEAERRAAIEGPAQVTGRAFEAGLVERILNDVGDAPGDLPLLEFALTELWAQQTAHGLLTHAAYGEIDRVQGALARRAEALYHELERGGHGDTVRRILLRLIHYGEGIEGTRRRVPLDELSTPGTPGNTVEPVVRSLTNARLLVTGRDGATGTVTVEVAHEALIRNWARLRQWLDEDRAFGLWRERLAIARRTWTDTQRDEGALLRGAPLAEAQRWLEERPDDLNPTEQRYIQASVELRERGQAARKRDWVLFDALGGSIGGILGGLVGGTLDLLVAGVGSDQGVIGTVVGSGLFGAMTGGAIALGIGLGSVLDVRRSIQGVVGGTAAGTLPGALIGWFYGQGSNLDSLRCAILGAVLGAVYGGGIALGVVVGRKLEKRERLVVRALAGAVAGALTGLAWEGVVIWTGMGLTISVAVGLADDSFLPESGQRGEGGGAIDQDGS